MVVVDRLIRGIGVDLAGAVAVDLRSDVAEKFGQLRFVVGAHAFARGTPLGFGGHDRDGTVYRPGRPQAGSPAGTRAARRSDLLLRTGGDAPAHVEIRSRNASRRGRPALIAIADFAPRRGGIRRWEPRQIGPICVSAGSGLLCALLSFRWDEIERGAWGHGRLALDAGLEFTEEPVEVGDRP